MARMARLVIPGMPHHVTQRGNGKQQAFFSARDYGLYLRLLRDACQRTHVRCLAYCLMPNHTHMILVPAEPTGLSHCLAHVHRTYAGIMNIRRSVTGHFWQGRFHSVVMDDPHLYEAVRYVLLNPVRARLTPTPASWRWSSAAAYLGGHDDRLTDVSVMRAMVSDFVGYLAKPADDVRIDRLRRNTVTGRPAVSVATLRKLETLTGRRLAPRPPGPPSRRMVLVST